MLVHDLGHAYMPLTLQWDPELVDQQSVLLDHLFRSWHDAMGMRASLLSMPELLCIHLDRLLPDAAGRLRRIDTEVLMLGPISVPPCGMQMQMLDGCLMSQLLL